jgi:hypothetical protein
MTFLYATNQTSELASAFCLARGPNNQTIALFVMALHIKTMTWQEAA